MLLVWPTNLDAHISLFVVVIVVLVSSLLTYREGHVGDRRLSIYSRSISRRAHALLALIHSISYEISLRYKIVSRFCMCQIFAYLVKHLLLLSWIYLDTSLIINYGSRASLLLRFYQIMKKEKKNFSTI